MRKHDEKVSGVLTLERLRATPGYPSRARMEKGPVAVIECVEEIPCNPCESACRFGAIRVGKPITNLPVLDEKKCTGCGRCVPACPGLAIFVVDMKYSESEAAVSIPYEYLPLPEKGQRVEVLNRAGEKIAEGKVVRVGDSRGHEGTAVVTFTVPKELAEEARHIRLPGS